MHDAANRGVAALRQVIFAAALWLCAGVVITGAGPVWAQTLPELSGLARLEPARSTQLDDGKKVEITLGISQPVPFRAFLLDNPPRLVADFREVDFGRARPERPLGDGLLKDIRWGRFRPGWSRLVAELSGPVRLDTAVEETGAEPRIILRVVPSSAADFAARAGAPTSALWDLPQPVVSPLPHQRQDGSHPLKVVIDPGHGGIDPGAEVGAIDEAVLTLTFARELKEAMARAGMQVVMTRTEDVFVPLDARVTRARAEGADVFISLHADALASGDARGATIYLPDDKAAGDAAQRLVERHDRSDLLSGVDLAGQDDVVVSVLMDMARVETRPRTEKLGQNLVDAMKQAGIDMHPHAVQHADFAVLRAPDIPSVLVELGFMSSDADLKRLLDADQRTQMVRALVAGVEAWAQSDAAEARLLRQ